MLTTYLMLSAAACAFTLLRGLCIAHRRAVRARTRGPRPLQPVGRQQDGFAPARVASYRGARSLR